MNLFSGQVTPARTVRTAKGLQVVAPVPSEIATGAAVHVAVRPERTRLVREKPTDGLALRGTLRQVLYLGATREFRVELDGGERGFVETPNDGTAPPFEPGATVWLAASFANCRVLPASAEPAT